LSGWDGLAFPDDQQIPRPGDVAASPNLSDTLVAFSHSLLCDIFHGSLRLEKVGLENLGEILDIKNP
jgi:hypothetical protein